MRGTDATLEEQELLATLYARMVLKMRYTQPPAGEAHLYERGIMDIDQRDGTTIYDIPVWYPRAESDAWVEARFRPRWNEIGRA